MGWDRWPDREGWDAWDYAYRLLAASRGPDEGDYVRAMWEGIPESLRADVCGCLHSTYASVHNGARARAFLRDALSDYPEAREAAAAAAVWEARWNSSPYTGG